MARLVFIGDVHCKFDRLLQILNEYSTADRIYQLGDFGIGFPGVAVPSLPQNFRFIRGNHDNPEEARKHPNYLGDYGVDEFGVGYIGGAWSIDHYRLTAGVDWWHNEQLHYLELDRAVSDILDEQPRIMISHCAPSEFENHLIPNNRYGSTTTDALDEIVKEHLPARWFCGHYHKPVAKTVGSVKYKCLAELELFELEIDDNGTITI